MLLGGRMQMSELPDRESTKRERVRDYLLASEYPYATKLARFVNDDLRSRDEMNVEAMRKLLIAPVIPRTAEEMAEALADAAWEVVEVWEAYKRGVLKWSITTTPTKCISCMREVSDE